MPRLKIIAVDKSINFQRVLKIAVETTGVAKIAKILSSNDMILEVIGNNYFDVVILSAEDDGIKYLMQIKEIHPDIKIIIMGDRSLNNELLSYLQYGAADFLVKPVEDNIEKCVYLLKIQFSIIFNQIHVRNSLREQQKTIDECFSKKVLEKSKVIDEDRLKKKTKLRKVDLILIASSTGGPKAVNKVISKLKIVRKPIMIVQHMPKGFTKDFADDLSRRYDLNVLEGYQGHILKNNHVVVAPGDHHMLLKKKEKFQMEIIIEKSGPVNSVRPSADVLFNSVAEEFCGISVLAVVLTGMGKDGSDGVESLKNRCKCYCIVQNKETCAVYGMPKMVYERGLADEVVDIDDIADRINHIIEKGS